MKEKILPFIIGVLVGAIIATAGFAIYSKVNKNNHKGFRDGTPPQMMQNGNSDNRGTPPDLPNGAQKTDNQSDANSQDGTTQSTQQQTPPELPANNDNTTSQSQS